MDQNFIGATPATVVNHHHTSNSAISVDYDEVLDNLLRMDLSEFDLSLFDIPLPLSSQQPVTGEMPIDPVPAPVQPPQVSDSVNLIEMNSARPACGGNRGGESVLGHRRDSNRVFLGSGSSAAPSYYRKRTVIPPEKLAELEKSDPKKAQRIVANRVSAKISKEKKKNYVKELEKRVELLQIKADNAIAERMMAMKEAMELVAEYKRVKELIRSKLEHQEKQKAVIALMKEEANIIEMQIHEMNTAMADLSFNEPASQFQLPVPHQPELYIPPQPPQVPRQPELYIPPQPPLVPRQPELYTPPQPPLVPHQPEYYIPQQPPLVPYQPELYIPQQPPLVPPPPSSFGEPLLPPLPSPFGDPLVPPLLSPIGESLVPPPQPPFGEPFSDHFIGGDFSNNPWN